MQKFLGGTVVLALGIAIPASLHGSWVAWIAWGIAAVAGVVLIAFSKPVLDRLPFYLTKKDSATESAIRLILQTHLLRSDLQKALSALGEMKGARPAELRAFAANVAQRLRDAGYDVAADRVEVALPDNADAAAVEKRRSDLGTTC